MKEIDLRSDTVTRPSRRMLEEMMKAEVGDDVFGEDPTVNRLQRRVAELFKKDDALFIPSGTMGNEIAIKAYTQPGDEVIVEQDSHIFVYETAGASLLSGVQLRPLPGTKGLLHAAQIQRAIRPKAYYLPPTKLICMENTHGRAGGTILPLDEIARVRDLSLREKIPMHLDGARLWNACAATGLPPERYAAYFDSLSVCFSKGLGAPIGSMLVGTAEFIERARRYRKIFGGGMRQVGILASAAAYALDHNFERLKLDHDNARYLAEGLQGMNQLKIDMDEVQTNMVIIEIEGTGKTQTEVLKLLKDNEILMTPERFSSIRAVTHLDVSREDIGRAVEVFRALFR